MCENKENEVISYKNYGIENKIKNLESNYKVMEDSDKKKRISVLLHTLDYLSLQWKNLHSHAFANMSMWEKNHKDLDECKIEVISGDWGEITQKMSKTYGKTYAVLNFANAKCPGGGYIEGCVAQEENIFRRSSCHFYINRNILNSKTNTYTDYMIDLHNAVNGKIYIDVECARICIKTKEENDFIVQPDNSYKLLYDDSIFPFYEMRGAADDLRRGGVYNNESMTKKIEAQFNTMIEKNVEHCVLGAFGCGAFENPPARVANIYKKMIDKHKNKFKHIVFAIYNAGYGSNNFGTFNDILISKTSEPSEPSEPIKQIKQIEINSKNTVNPQKKHMLPLLGALSVTALSSLALYNKKAIIKLFKSKNNKQKYYKYKTKYINFKKIYDYYYKNN